MDRFDAWYERERPARQNQVLDLVTEYRYLAPAMLALEERHAQFLAEAAHSRLPPARAASAMPTVRRRLGDLLIRLGTHLQGVPAGELGGPAANAAASSTGG